MRKVIIKNEITTDYILDLYEDAKKIKDEKKKAKALKQIKVLSQHIGEYIVKPTN
jgi:hypothetical protein